MQRFDLNLMAALDALLRERSVSAAAARLGVGQPAMSAALGRLRALFDDPLFVRTPRGMEPTPRALGVEAELAEALAAMRALVAPPSGFDPATSTRTFRIRGGDYVGMVVLPPLMRALAAVAPRVDARYRFIEKGGVLASLDAGDIDLAFAVLEARQARFLSETLFEETFVCVGRVGHPLFDDALTPERFAAASHVLVTEQGDDRGAIDEALAPLGLSRRVALTVPQTSLLRDVLANTDLIATVGRRCAALPTAGALTCRELPFPTSPWRMSMIWTARDAKDEGLAWLRAEAMRAAASTA